MIFIDFIKLFDSDTISDCFRYTFMVSDSICYLILTEFKLHYATFLIRMATERTHKMWKFEKSVN